MCAISGLVNDMSMSWSRLAGTVPLGYLVRGGLAFCLCLCSIVVVVSTQTQEILNHFLKLTFGPILERLVTFFQDGRFPLTVTKIPEQDLCVFAITTLPLFACTARASSL